jgi:AmmeMemoRadiSam system protein A
MLPPPEDQPAGSRLACGPHGAEPNEYSAEERTLLLRLAHEAVLSVLEHREISLTPPSPHLAEPRGAFTTLYVGGGLRGCVGYVLPVTSLYRTIAETARSAAFEDSRFLPVTRDEISELTVSLSILSPLVRAQPEEIEIGRHGLLVSRAGHRGLLLPQVAVEHGWDRVTFLEQVCHKAGLPFNAWRTGATLEAFTAEVFGDRHAPTS